MNIKEIIADETASLINVFNSIEDVSVKKANIGFEKQNVLKIYIEDPKKYSKWEYFLSKVCKDEVLTKLVVKKDLPEITFIFPVHEGELISALHQLNSLLGRKFHTIEKPHIKKLTIIAKITNLCNIDCKYCYDRPFRECIGHNGILKTERLEHLLEMASKYAEDVEIIWHGGEPTLAGTDYFRNVADNILPKYPYTNWQMVMQSNGTLFNEDWFKLSRDYNIPLGSSYNATSEDLRHTQKDNKLSKEGQTIDNVLENVKAAKEYGLGTGVIDVLTKRNHKDIIDIYEFYKKEGVCASFNEILNAGEAEKHDFLFITPEEVRQYLETTTEYFKYWLKDKSEEAFPDRYAAQSIQMLTTGNAQCCSFSGSCVGHWITINSNGDLYPCDRALPPKYRFGNVMEFQSLEEVYESSAFKTFKEERMKKLQKCSKCYIHSYCHGACPMEDIDEHGTAEVKSTMACKMRLCNLLAAYKALCSVTFEECNEFVQGFLINRFIVLPNEIPSLVERIGLKEKFPNLDFSPNNAKFGTTEFSLFQSFNSPIPEERIENKIDRCECKPDLSNIAKVKNAEELKNIRLEAIEKNLRLRAKELENKVKREGRIL